MAVDSKSSEKGKSVNNENFKSRMKRDKAFQTKVVIRRLPPSMTEEQFIEQLSPLPEHDYMYFVKADMRLGQHGFSRAYINFIIPEDIFIFKDKFDGYVFLDSKGNEYPAIVEFAPFQKIPKKRSKKRDAKCGTVSNDPDYLKFLENIKNPEEVTLPSAEAYLEEIESREKEIKANNGCLKATTPLIEFIKARKIEQQKIREEKREERKRKEMEKKRIREEERRRRKAEKEKAKEKNKEKDSLSEKEATDEHEEPATPDGQKLSEPVVQVLKNPEREKDQKEIVTPQKGGNKEHFVSSSGNKEKNKKEWDRVRPKERQKVSPRVYTNEKERSRYKTRENTSSKEYKSDKSYGKKRYHDIEHSTTKHKEVKETETHKNTTSADNTKSEEKEKKESSTVSESQFSPKDKRDNSCPGNVESLGEPKNGSPLTSAQFKNSSKSVTEDCSETSEKNDGDCFDYKDGKDPRMERRIKNKDRPTLEIYRPGMRRFSTQRNSPQKEVSTSASNSSSPSPTPPPVAKTQKEKDHSKSEET